MKLVHQSALALLLAVCTAVTSYAHAGPIAYTAWDVSGSDKLLRIDLGTGAGVVVGTGIGFNDVDGLAFSSTGELFGVHDGSGLASRLIKIDTDTGVGTDIGSLGTPSFNSFDDMGLAFVGSTLFMASNDSNTGISGLFTVNTSTGTATHVGNFSSVKVRSLGAYGGVLYGWSNVDTLLKIDTSTAATTLVGAFGFSPVTQGKDGMDIDPATGVIWGISEFENRTYTISAATGAATVVANSLTCNGAPCLPSGGFSSLAIAAPVPEPGAYSMAFAGLLVCGWRLRRRG